MEAETSDLEKKIEELAVVLGGDFLEEMNGKHDEMPIMLLGSGEHTLNLFKRELDKYFKRRGKTVTVFTRNGGAYRNEAYPIDVGYFLSLRSSS